MAGLYGGYVGQRKKKGLRGGRTSIYIYAGNLSFEVDEKDLRRIFETYGEVGSAEIIRLKGKSKGFGFVEMLSKAEAEAAIQGLNGNEIKGRTLVVAEACPRPGRQGN